MVNSLILTLCKEPFSATKVIKRQQGMVVNYVTGQVITKLKGRLPKAILEHPASATCSVVRMALTTK